MGKEGGEAAPKAPAKAQKRLLTNLRDLTGITLDGVVTGEARMQMMEKEANVKKNPDGTDIWGAGANNWPELTTTVLLHLCATGLQYSILVLFSASFIEKEARPYGHVQLQNTTELLNNAIRYTDQAMAKGQETFCAENAHYPMVHRLVLLIWLTIMFPDIFNNFWRFWRLWLTAPCNNENRKAKSSRHMVLHKAAEKDETTKRYEYTEKDNEKKSLKMVLDEASGDYCTQKEKKYPWMKHNFFAEEFGKRMMIEDNLGNMQDLHKFEKDSKSSNKDIPHDAYPVRVLMQEIDESHIVGNWSCTWKIFSTVFALFPGLGISVYLAIMGTKLIINSGDFGELIRRVLYLKFIYDIPSTVFEGYASQNLKDYLETSSYYVYKSRTPNAEKATDVWGKWLATLIKVTLFIAATYIIYYSVYQNVYDVRSLCTVFNRKFPPHPPEQVEDNLWKWPHNNLWR